MAIVKGSSRIGERVGRGRAIAVASAPGDSHSPDSCPTACSTGPGEFQALDRRYDEDRHPEEYRFPMRLTPRPGSREGSGRCSWFPRPGARPLLRRPSRAELGNSCRESASCTGSRTECRALHRQRRWPAASAACDPIEVAMAAGKSPRAAVKEVMTTGRTRVPGREAGFPD